MLRQQRHEELIRVLTQRGALPIKQVAEILEVSEATARRDMNELAEAGRLSRVYGGAVVRGPVEVPFAYSESVDHDEKARIAAAAAGFVSDSDTVILDIGSTVLEVARLLAGRSVTIVTSNMAVYDLLKNESQPDIILLGGELRRNYRSTVGFLSESAMRQIHADLAILGTSGVTRAGEVLDTTPVEVPIKRRMIRSADRVVLVATERKFPGQGCGVVCTAEDVSTLVTADRTPSAFLDAFTAAGTEVITA